MFVRISRLFAFALLALSVASPCALHADERTERLKSLVEERAEVSANQKADTSTKGKTSEPPRSEISVVRVVEGLLLTLGVFFIGMWGYRKLSGNSLPKTSARRIKVVERVAVGGKTALVLAEIDGRSVLMSVGSERVAFFGDSAWLEGAWEKEQQTQEQA